MTTLDQDTDSTLIRMLGVGESGTGKTGALASLVLAGYRLWLLDFDNGRSILRNVLRTKDPSGEALRRVTFRAFHDEIVMGATGLPRVKAAKAYKEAGKTLIEWGADGFTSNDIVCLDTLTSFSQAGFNEALVQSGRLNQRPQLQDYGWLADSVLAFIDSLTDQLPCHIIVNTHIKYFAGDEDMQILARGLPNAKGQQISKDIGKFFNTCVLFRTTGTGIAAKRQIFTDPLGVIEVKTESPFTVKRSYPIDTGLAMLFSDILCHGPTGAIAPPPTAQSAQPQTKDVN